MVKSDILEYKSKLIKNLIFRIYPLIHEDKNEKPSYCTMHGPHSVSDIGHCAVIHCAVGDVSLVDQ